MKVKTILVVDKTTANLNIFITLLDGYSVITAKSGEDALKIANSKNVDLILLDIMIPNINGFEVCKILKDNPKTKDIPLIFITSLGDEDSIERAYELGGIDYIIKPFKPRELLSKIKTQFNIQDLKNSICQMNETLESRVKEEIEKNRQQELILLQQNRLAQMGEMINMIAHQWRQPLTSISTSIQNLIYDYEDGMLNDDKHIKSFIDKNKKTISFMSQTIDDFRNFFKIDKNKESFDVLEATQKVLDMQQAQLQDYNIKIDIEGSSFKFLGFESEYQQVILNLISNAKDALVEKKIKNPKIDIVLDKNKIIVKDNAGGILDEVIGRVFEPYFTTKEQGKGTGIGLYMSKMIIENNMDGNLSVKNNENGAEFTIFFKS